MAWALLGLLAALVVTNVVLSVLVHVGGPLIGVALYAVSFVYIRCR